MANEGGKEVFVVIGEMTYFNDYFIEGVYADRDEAMRAVQRTKKDADWAYMKKMKLSE